MQFEIFGDRQVVLSEESIVHDLFVKRSAKYSGRGIPHAIKYMTRDQSIALMPKNGAQKQLLPKNDQMLSLGRRMAP
jgi:hypothetical protein